MKRVFIIPLLVICLLFLSSVVSAENYYKVPYYCYGSGNDVYCPTIQSNQITSDDLETNMTIYGNFNGSNYDVTANYYSPHSNLVATSEREFLSDVECESFGTQKVININDNLETRGNLIDTASSSSFTLKSVHEVRSDDIILTFNASSDKVDSSDYEMNTFFTYSTTTSTPLDQTHLDGQAYAEMNYTGDNYNECGEYYQSHEKLYLTALLGAGATKTVYFHRFFMFNSSSGEFNYSYAITNKIATCGLSPTYDFNRIGYYKLEDDPTWQNIGTSASGSGTLNLESNELYVFQVSTSIGARASGGDSCTYHIYEGDYNNVYDIKAYIPKWVCGEWSECENGIQSRVCEDLSDIVSDKIEIRFCYVAPDESVYLGFEDVTAENVWYNYIGFGCSCQNEIKEILYPDNWTVENPLVQIVNEGNKIGYNFDFIKMTSELAYEGDKSLKMWNLPPQLRIPEVSGFVGIANQTCPNVTLSSGLLSGISANGSCANPIRAVGNDGQTADCEGEFDEYVQVYDYPFDWFDETAQIINISVIIIVKQEDGSDTNLSIRLWHNTSGTYTDEIIIPETDMPNSLTTFNFYGLWNKTWNKNDLLALKVNASSVYGTQSGGGDKDKIDWLGINITYICDLVVMGDYSIWDNMLCGNLSVGVFPDIRKSISTNNTTSIFVEKNITLPTPYMSTSFKVRKCVNPELKFSANYWCLDFDDNCYTHGESCNIETKGTITFYLKDGYTGNFLYDIKSEVEYPNKWEIREYAIDSLQPNHLYTIGFAVVPESTVDPNYYCVYIDDVNIDIRSQPLVCESECDDLNEIKRYCKDYEDGFCIVCEEIAIINSPNCISSPNVIDKVESCESFCGCELYEIGDPEYHTKFIGELLEDCNTTLHGIDGCCEYSEIENSEYCEEFCDTWETGEGFDIFAPIEEVEDIFEDTNIPVWSARLISPIMLIFYIIIIIMSFVTFKTGSWQIGIVTALLILSGVATIFPQLLFIVIIVIIIAGFLLAKSIYPK